MKTQELQEILELASVFKEAMEARVGGDDALAARLAQSLQPDEAATLEDLVNRIVEDGLAPFKGDDALTAYLRLNLTHLEKVTELALRVLPAAELAPLMPLALRSAEIGRRLETWKAPKLAGICTFSLN